MQTTLKVMSNSSNTSGGGISFVGLLTIAFIILKLTGVIAWSWMWVLSPIWIMAIVALLVCAVVLATVVFKK